MTLLAEKHCAKLSLPVETVLLAETFATICGNIMNY